MELYKFNKQHYNTLVEWWKKHEHHILPYSSLSDIGVIVYKNNKPISASWIYFMNGCDLAQIAWTTTNPDSGLKEKYKAVNLCLDALLDIAKINKRNNVICLSNSTGLTKLVSKKGLNKNKKHDFLVGSFMEDK